MSSDAQIGLVYRVTPQVTYDILNLLLLSLDSVGRIYKVNSVDDAMALIGEVPMAAKEAVEAVLKKFAERSCQRESLGDISVTNLGFQLSV